MLDLRARDASRFWRTLSLPDEQLIAALGGKRREQLRSWHATLPDLRPQPLPAGVQRICRHCPAYPHTLTESPLAPHELHLLGGVDRLQQALAQPVVAIVGTHRCSDYGMEIARGLGHELARAGVSVIAELTDGIALWAHAGALEAQGSGIGVVGGGVDTCAPACVRPVYRGLAAAGCLLAELPCGCAERRWSALARARTLALLAQLVIVVEAGVDPRELACALLACQLAKKLGAVPGRVSARQSQGTSWLIRQGACLIRGAHDALEALYETPASQMPAGRISVEEMPATETPGQLAAAREAELSPELERALRLIGEGRDTVAKLSGRPDDVDATLATLAELELRGVVFRGDGGRYVPRFLTH
jgi:DNA processing protein